MDLIESLLSEAGPRGATMAELMASPRGREAKLTREQCQVTLRDLVEVGTVRQVPPDHPGQPWRYVLARIGQPELFEP